MIFTCTAIPGAKGYQVSTNGGQTYSPVIGLANTVINLKPGQSGKYNFTLTAPKQKENYDGHGPAGTWANSYSRTDTQADPISQLHAKSKQRNEMSGVHRLLFFTRFWLTKCQNWFLESPELGTLTEDKSVDGA